MFSLSCRLICRQLQKLNKIVKLNRFVLKIKNICNYLEVSSFYIKIILKLIMFLNDC